MKNQFKVAILLLSFILFFTVFYYALKSNTKNNPQVMVGTKLPAIELQSKEKKLFYQRLIKINFI